jgi:UDPglucose--hexose-1-phosphate uridylyltransferase
MNVYRDQTCNYMTCKKIYHTSFFNNSRKAAGASLNDPHSQLLPFHFVLLRFKGKLKLSGKGKNVPIVQSLILKKLLPDLHLKNNKYVTFAPFYSMVPFEVWILSRKYVNFLEDGDEELLFALDDIFISVLRS